MKTNSNAGRSCPPRTALWVLLSGACYYLSTRIAWELCFPDSKVCLFFPPHAVLVSVLLLVPTRHWWAYTLAAVCSHFVATQQAHWPPLYALHCEVFDAAQNVSTAAGIRLLIKSPFKWITLPDAIIFILVAVVIVPFGTAFWGAAFTVSNHFGTHYWVEWRNLGISNAVTAILLVPAILLGFHHLSAQRIRVSPARMFEAAILGTSIVTAGVFAFDKAPAGPDASPALLYAPIPLLIWAALRFGLGGMSASMLVITVQAIWGTMHGRGPFLNQTPAENALALQLFLLVMAIPLMLLAVIVEEEKRSKNALRESEAQLLKGRAELKDQLCFELLATDISSTLMRVPPEELGKQIVPALEKMAQLLGFDVATLAVFTSDGAAQLPYVWHEPDTPGLPLNLTDKDFPWSARELLAGRDVHIRKLDDFPPEAQTDRATYERHGLKSALDVPVLVSGQPVGVLSMGSFRKELSVSPQLVERQRALGNIFGNALVRARSQIALRESEERMVLATEAAQLGMWMWDIPRNKVWLSDKLRELLGYSATEAVTYDSFLRRVHEDDRENVNQVVQRALAQGGRYHGEYRVVRPDGTLRWMAGTGRVKADSKGAPVLLLGVSMDISERRRAEEESREVSGKLITAQEDERKRIARDLHDDLNQRLAMLSVQMEIFGADSKDNSGAARELLDSMTLQVKELSSEVHRLSYQLHPAKLDQLGLVAAARTFCREVSAQSGIAVHFEQHDMPRDLDVAVALCLYRVLQEAVQNSVRHGDAAAIQVKLTCAGEQIDLLVADDGKGFAVDHAMHNGGLGLVSMRERVRQVNGSIQFNSSPGRGTRVEVTAPLLRQLAAK